MKPYRQGVLEVFRLFHDVSRCHWRIGRIVPASKPGGGALAAAAGERIQRAVNLDEMKQGDIKKLVKLYQ